MAEYNLYLVISEVLETVEWEDWFNYVGHRETYRIVELVVARNHGQARWIAWRERDEDATFLPDVRDMPKFAVRLKRKDAKGPPRIVSDDWCEEPTEDKELDRLWYLGDAPHIGIVADREMGS